MGGYAHTFPMIYVVGWRDAGVLKNGYSSRQRWRKFMLRGAEVLGLYEFPTSGWAAIRFETYLDDKASMLYPRAFTVKTDEAERLLGTGCGGYLECFRGDIDEWSRLIPEHCHPSIAQARRIA